MHKASFWFLPEVYLMCVDQSHSDKTGLVGIGGLSSAQNNGVKPITRTFILTANQLQDHNHTKSIDLHLFFGKVTRERGHIHCIRACKTKYMGKTVPSEVPTDMCGYPIFFYYGTTLNK